MDSDSPNLNNAAHDYREKWEAQRKEMTAKAEALDAERRLKANDGMKNFSEEFDAMTDWTEAKWDEFTAKVAQWWNEFETDADEAV